MIESRGQAAEVGPVVPYFDFLVGDKTVEDEDSVGRGQRNWVAEDSVAGQEKRSLELELAWVALVPEEGASRTLALV